MLVTCDKTFLSVTKNLTLWTWPWLLAYFWKNLTLAITFEPKEIRLSYYTCWFLVTRPFCLYQKNWPCDLDLDFWPTFEKKLNLGYNFWTKRDEAFILHMLVPCDKTFLSVPKKLTLWPWPWLLTYFWKNFTLAIPFEIRLSYYRYVIPCDKTFRSVPKKLTLWPWPWLLTYFWKNLTLVITFEPREIRLSYYRYVFLVARTICWKQNLWPWLLTYFWKNLTLTIHVTFEPKVIRL